MESIWKEVKKTIKDRIPDHSYRMWIEPICFLSSSEDGYYLSCPNEFSKKWVTEHYLRILESEIGKHMKRPCMISFRILSPSTLESNEVAVETQLELPNMSYKPIMGRLLRKEFTFDEFVVGENNHFAYYAARELTKAKRDSQNFLYLLSKTGLGKSHLSQAVGHQIINRHPRNRVCYITAEDFTNEMIHAIRHDSIDKFKDKYRSQCDVLLLEDIHFLSGKERTQVELAFTLDNLVESDKKIVFTSCYSPGEIPKMNDNLRSRISSGLISNIEPPDYKTRIKIMKRKCNMYNYRIPEDVIHYLAGELTENIRQIESGIIGVAAKSSLLGVPINLDLAQGVVKNIVVQNKAITIESIKKMVCRYFNVTISDIVSRSRKQSIVRPRQIAMYLSRKFTDQPLQEIGRSYNRYHATALHAIGAVEKELKTNPQIQKQIDILSSKLESGTF